MALTDLVSQVIETEVLIIGSEAAGAKAAIEAQEDGAEVLVVTKGLLGKSGNTVMARGGIQAILGENYPQDDPEVFFADVIKAGAYLNNQELVERLVKLSLTEVPKLEKWGAKFNKKDDRFVRSQFPGSSYPRTLHPFGLYGGLQWRKAFKFQLRRLKTKVMEDIFITRLLLSKGQVSGAFGISLRDGQYVVFRSKKTILATGGASQIYLKTDTSADATGDGMVIAFNAGAELMDLEFQQFIPGCCYSPPFEMDLLTNTLRYYLHAKFYNCMGESFLERYLPLSKEWGLRDVTARAIYLENMQGRGSPHGGAYIAVNHLPENLIDDWIEREKPPFISKLEKAGIDIRRHALEAGPSAHYSMGGIRINKHCETTSLPRLYAIGEVAAGMDGAERLDATAITWCLGMGYIAGKDAARMAKELDWLDIEVDQVKEERNRLDLLWHRQQGCRGFLIKKKVKDIMWTRCALIRNTKGLDEGIAMIQKIKEEDLPRLCVSDSSKVLSKGWVEALEAANLVSVAELVMRAALMREESRRSHYRSDFPKMNNEKWTKNIVLKKETGKTALFTVNPVITKIKPPEKEVLEQ